MTAAGRLLTLCVVAALLSPGAASAELRKPKETTPLAARSLLLDGARAGGRLIVVGGRGHILVSDDEAVSWRQVPSPTGVMLTAIHMHDDRLGWAVGHDAVVVRTRDGGESWQRVHHAPEEERPLLDVWFADARRGLAVGAYGYLLATGDGGDTWTSRAVSEDDYHLNALAPAGGGRIFIAGEVGTAYRSDDGGVSWSALATPYSGSWFGAVAVSAETVLLVGLRGHMLRSDDGGMTWKRTVTGATATLTSVQRLPSGRILVTGLEGVLLEGPDGGGVELRRLPARTGIAGALALSDGGLLLIGEFGVRRLVSNP